MVWTWLIMRAALLLVLQTLCRARWWCVRPVCVCARLTQQGGVVTHGLCGRCNVPDTCSACKTSGCDSSRSTSLCVVLCVVLTGILACLTQAFECLTPLWCQNGQAVHMLSTPRRCVSAVAGSILCFTHDRQTRILSSLWWHVSTCL